MISLELFILCQRTIIGGRCHKYHYSREKHELLLRQKPACRDKSVVVLHVFVATKHATKVCLSRQNFCRDRHVFVTTFLYIYFFFFFVFLFLSRYTYFFSRHFFFVATKLILVAAAAFARKGQRESCKPTASCRCLCFLCLCSIQLQRSEGSDADTYYSTF